MLIFDQLKKNDPQLRWVAVGVSAGMVVLLVGLWWVQVVSARDYRQHLETQAFRTVRIPAVRGKILDRTGKIVLAENQPTYNISLYLEELKDEFRKEYATARPRQVVKKNLPLWQRWLGASSVRTQYVKLRQEQLDALTWSARYKVASNTVAQLAARLHLPLALDFTNFQKHYAKSLYVPYPVAPRVDATNIARFAEQFTGTPGVDLEIQSTRAYPNQTTAAHLLGYLRRNNDSIEGEEAYFSYRLPDYRGVIGIEGGYDTYLHGRAGEKSILVNSLGYRQTENIWTPAEPGRNVVLTIDLQIQQATERALRRARVDGVPRGAAVVMDVRTGDVLAMASTPTFDPNDYARGLTRDESARLNDPVLRPQINRAMQENYQPGSIFKPIVAMACIEKGLDPEALYEVQPNPHDPVHGIIYVGRTRQSFKDTAPPGHYNFRRALIHSSNSYFIAAGLKTGIEDIVRLGHRLHLGERIGLATGQETRGNFPSLERVRTGWYDGDTANVCIGQGGIDVTPLQMAVFAASLANGGKVLWPRVVDRIESQDLLTGEPPTVIPAGQARDTLGVRPRTLQILKQAMLADTEDPEGTAYGAFQGSALQKLMRVCGKTGTSQKKDAHGHLETWITWFLSFAPYENPRYAVVVMIEGGTSGGGTCAPVGREIYEGILQAEQTRTAGAVANAR